MSGVGIQISAHVYTAWSDTILRVAKFAPIPKALEFVSSEISRAPRVLHHNLSYSTIWKVCHAA
jgi:hypothetical protein